ncbi:MAG: hypothetical protein ACRDGA_13745 [Bacteroidota bacterium]
MDFVLWACRVVHLTSAVVWLGGLIFLNAVLKPVVDYRKGQQAQLNLEILKRFQPFIWSSVWPLLVTGLLLMLLSPRFIWFDVSSLWSKLLVVKQVSFLLLVFFSWQMGKVLQKLGPAMAWEEFEGWWMAYSRLVRRSIFTGIVTLLAAAGMAVV